MIDKIWDSTVWLLRGKEVIFLDGKYMIDGRELSDDELLEFERAKNTQKDGFEMLVDLVDAINNSVVGLFNRMTELSFAEKNTIIATFFQQIDGIEIPKLPISVWLQEKIVLLRDEYQAFFDDIPKFLDPSSSWFLILDSGFTHYKNGFAIFRCSKWGTKEIFFTMDEFKEMLYLVKNHLLILKDYSY